MKKNHWITLIGIALVLGVYAVPATAQQPAQQQAAPAQYIVAIVDVAQLIKMHPEFTAKQEALKAEVQRAEDAFNARKEEIGKKQKNLEASTYKPGTQEHQRLLDDITTDMAKFEADAKSLQRQFALKNSQIMFDTYQDIKKTIGAYAMANNIMQVTDYREFTPDPADPQSVAEDMDQRLVWFNDRLNITKHIIYQIYASRNLPQPNLSQTQNAIGNPPGTASAARTATAPTGAAPTSGGIPMQR